MRERSIAGVMGNMPSIQHEFAHVAVAKMRKTCNALEMIINSEWLSPANCMLWHMKFNATTEQMMQMK